MSTSVWDGIYTAAQAAKGADEFGQSCASCHGAGLEGTGEAPGLTGGKSLSDYDGLTMGDLSDRTRKSMPQDAPDSLSRETYANILAYVLKMNGFPTGSKPLDHRTPYLRAIAFVATNPHPGAPASAAAAPAAPPSTPPAAGRAGRRRGAAGSCRRRRPSGGAGCRGQGIGCPVAHRGRSAQRTGQPARSVSGRFRLPEAAGGPCHGVDERGRVDSKGHIWVVDRCGANNCADSTLDPIMEFDVNGAFIKAFGGGMSNFPHGFFIDRDDHIWITDVRAANGKGADVLEFDESGKLLRTSASRACRATDRTRSASRRRCSWRPTATSSSRTVTRPARATPRAWSSSIRTGSS